MVEPMVEPMASEPVPTTPRLPGPRTGQEQGHEEQAHPDPLLPCSHGHHLSYDRVHIR
jgi:hypothetical protein